MDSDQRTPQESQDEQQPGEAVTLNYIDKVYTSLTKQWEAQSRTLAVQTILSLITVAVCIGAVTPQEKFSLVGLGLNASITTVLTGSAFLIAALHVLSLGSIMRSSASVILLNQLYEKSGIQDTQERTDSLASPTTSPSPLFTVYSAIGRQRTETRSWFTEMYEGATAFMVGLGFLLVLPVAAETAALIKVASLTGWGENFLWVVLVIPIGTSIAGSFTVWEWAGQ